MDVEQALEIVGRRRPMGIPDVDQATRLLAAEVRRQAAAIERVRALTDELAEYVAIRVRRALDGDE